MRGLRIGLCALLLLAAAVAVAGAAPPYDGSKPMQCSIETVMVCSDPNVCVRGSAATVNLPPSLNVDVGQRLISGAATGRTMIGHVSYMQPEWKTLLPLVGIGGALLFVSAIFFFLNMILTATVSRRVPQPVPEFADTVSGPDHAPAFVDRWQPWLAAAVILIVIAYGPTLVRLAVTTPLTTPGLRVW